jgi:Na+-transporting methylmalonyl-CoA/oxaloacetate decarboxylase gamma subunit
MPLLTWYIDSFIKGFLITFVLSGSAEYAVTGSATSNTLIQVFTLSTIGGVCMIFLTLLIFAGYYEPTYIGHSAVQKPDGSIEKIEKVKIKEN